MISRKPMFAHISRGEAAYRSPKVNIAREAYIAAVPPQCIGCPRLTFFHIPRIPPHRLPLLKTNHEEPILYGFLVS